MLCETKNMLCETQNMLYANTYHISKNDLTFHEWNLHFGTSRNLTFHEWNLHFGTSQHLTFHEWNLDFGTSRNLTFHEWNLHFGTSRNLTFHEWNLDFGTSRNLTFHEWNLHFGTGSIPSEPLGTWCKVSGGCPKPPRSFIGRTPSLSGCWGKKHALKRTEESRLQSQSPRLRSSARPKRGDESQSQSDGARWRKEHPERLRKHEGYSGLSTSETQGKAS